MAVSISAVDLDTSTDSVQDDFVPDSLKDFLAEADAALNRLLNDDALDGGDDKEGVTSNGTSSSTRTHSTRKSKSKISNGGQKSKAINKNDDSSILRDHHNKKNPTHARRKSGSKSASFAASTTTATTAKSKSNKLITPRKVRSTPRKSLTSSASSSMSVTSLNLMTPSPISKDLSCSTSNEDGETPSSVVEVCRPNPATLYNTTAEAREIAMDDNPSVCPDHGDSCSCHLIPRPPVFNMDLELEKLECVTATTVVVPEEGDEDNVDNDEEEKKENEGNVKELDKEEIITIQDMEGGDHQDQKKKEVKEVEKDEIVGGTERQEVEQPLESTVPVLTETSESKSHGEDQQQQTARVDDGEGEDYGHDEETRDEFDSETKVVEFFPMPQRLMTIPSGDTDLSFDDDSGNQDDKDIASFLPNTNTNGNRNRNTEGKEGSSEIASSSKKKKKNSSSRSTTNGQVMNKENEGAKTLDKTSSTVNGGRRAGTTIPPPPKRSVKRIHRVVKQRQQQEPELSSATKTSPKTATSKTTTERRKVSVRTVNQSRRSVTRQTRSSSRSSIGASVTSSTRLRTSTKTQVVATAASKLRTRVGSSRLTAKVAPTPKLSASGTPTTADAKLRSKRPATTNVPQSPKATAKSTEEAQMAKTASLDRLHSMLELIEEKKRKDPKDMKLRQKGASLSPALQRLKKKSLTEPKAPKLRSQDKNGERKYSSVGLRDTNKVKEKEMENQSNNIDWKKRELTVPRAPKFFSVQRHGERVYSTVGADAERKEREEKEKAHDEMLRKSDWNKRLPTKARAPRLVSAERLGERKYAAVGSREEEEVLSVVSESTLDWKNRKLTEPKAPRLLSSMKYGEKKYAVVGPSRDEVLEVEQPKVDWKNRKLTEPKAPRLSSLARLGERKYANAGSSRDAEEVEVKPLSKIDWKNRKLTVPKAPRLSLGHRSDDSSVRKSFVPEVVKPTPFKARPIAKGVVGGTKPVVVKKKTSRTTTTVAPFALSSRVQKKMPEKKPEEKINNKFKARPLPNFSSVPTSPENRARYKRSLTESKPFHLKTIEWALSPKEKRRQESMKLHRPSPMKSPKKRASTTPKLFHLSCAERPTHRLPEDKAKALSSALPMPPPSMTRITRESGEVSSVFPSVDSLRQCQTWNEPNAKPTFIKRRSLSEDLTEVSKTLRVQTNISSASLPKAPVSDPTKKKKVITAQRPFRLSTTKEKTKKESEKGEGSFRARPMPKFKQPKKSVSRRRLTTPKPFRLSSRTGTDKEEVKEEIDQRLAIRSKQSALAREKQFEETRDVVDKLEQLNSSLCAPMNKCNAIETENAELNGPVALPQDPEAQELTKNTELNGPVSVAHQDSAVQG